jgi:hypothetical protein
VPERIYRLFSAYSVAGSTDPTRMFEAEEPIRRQRLC